MAVFTVTLDCCRLSTVPFHVINFRITKQTYLLPNH